VAFRGTHRYKTPQNRETLLYDKPVPSATHRLLPQGPLNFLAQVGVFYWRGKWLYKHTFYRDDNFKLAFLDRLPNGFGEAHMSRRRPMPPELQSAREAPGSACQVMMTGLNTILPTSVMR